MKTGIKKFLPHILIIAVIVVGVIGPFGLKTANAGVLGFLNLSFKGVVASIGNFVLEMSATVLAISGYFLDAAISYSISNAGFGSMDVIKTGWTVTRDLANLFFIFILLYIAIATILRLSGYGMKELLAKVIIIALLVNFSLLITQVIIDSSNVLAMEFYDKISNIKNAKGEKMSLSAIYVNGLNPQSLFKVSTNEEADAVKFTDGQEPTLSQIAIITLLGSGMILTTAFVLFAAGVLFVVRLAILWILMVLAPLAFLAMALPATKGYASQWWKKLFDQSFFAPVFLALLYIVVKIIGEGSLLKQLGADNVAFSTAFGSPNDANVKLVLNFVILITLTIACLIVAKQMGAYGADSVMKWGQSARKWGQGYAGRVTNRYAAPVAERLASGTEKTKLGRVIGSGLRKVPLATMGLARAGTLGKPEIGKYERQYSSYSSAALENIKKSPRLNLLNRAQREAIENVEKKRKKKIEEEEILKTGTSIDKVKIIAKREKEAKEDAESKLATEKEKSSVAKPPPMSSKPA